MSKRGADKQITDRDRDDDDDSNHSIGEGFNKAPETALAGRKIRGLPQRKTGAGPSPGAAGAAKPPAFGAFGGAAFGAAPSTGGAIGASATPAANPFAALTSTSAATSPSTAPTAPSFGSGFSFGSNAAKPATPAAPPASGGFSFGSTAPSTASSATPSFGFAAKTDDVPKAPATGNGFSFGATAASTATPPSFTALSFGAPAPTKANGSAPAAPFSFGPSATAPGSNAPPAPFAFGASTPKAAAPGSTSSPSDAALTYFLALRGLNESLSAAVAAQIKQDPFTDLSSALVSLKSKYDAHRAKVEAEFKSAGAKAAAEATQIPTTSTATPVAPVKIPEIVTTPPVPSAAAPKPTLGLPAPPAAFSFGGKVVKPPTASAAPVTGGFTPKFEAPKKGDEKSAFSFPIGSTVPSAKSATDKAAAAPSFIPPPSPKPAPMPTPATFAKMANAPSAPSPLRFGRSASPPSTEEKKAAPPAGGFSFGATFGAIAKGDPPEKKVDEEKKAPAAAPAFSFGAATSTSTPTKPAAFSFAPAGSPPITSSFGAASPPSFGFGAVLDKKPTTPTNNAAGFTFGSSVGSAAPAFTGFGGPPKASTGFSFGAAAPAPAAAAAAALSAAAPVFSFSPATSPAPSSTAAAETTDGEAGATAPEDGAASGNSTPGGNPFAAAGAGEEDETVVHEARVKVWKLKGGAEELGIARLMIKEKEGDNGKKVRRVLARHDVNGAVLINFRLHPAFKATVNKTFVEFVGFAGSEPCPFRVRIKTGEQAEELKRQLEEAAKA